MWCVWILCHHHHHHLLLLCSHDPSFGQWEPIQFHAWVLWRWPCRRVQLLRTPVWPDVPGSCGQSCPKLQSPISLRGPDLVLCKIVFRRHNLGAKGACCCWIGDLFLGLLSRQSWKMFYVLRKKNWVYIILPILILDYRVFTYLMGLTCITSPSH